MIRVLEGDALAVLQTLPEQSVQMCCTSPPYFGLRDYGMPGQMGLEPTPKAYVAGMVAVFREVRRVLRNDGTLWLNIGDSYNNFRTQMGPGQAVHGREKLNGKPDVKSRARGIVGLKEKDLLGIPWMLAFALRADGWFLRSDIIWHKPNPMPESMNDRPTSAHEHVFLMSKGPKYFYDADAIREEATSAAGNGATFRGGGSYTGGQSFQNSTPVARQSHGNVPNETLSRNTRNVWTIATQPFSGAHFATMPPDLAERCIKAGTSERGCCAECGAPWARQINKQIPDAIDCKIGGSPDRQDGGSRVRAAPGSGGGTQLAQTHRGTDEWTPTCAHDAQPVPCTVLDPFGGSGTTGMVADRLGRDAILIELNPAYAAMARARITADAPLFGAVS